MRSRKSSMGSSASERARLVFRFRAVMVFFIVGLVLSGVTAFPLLTELRWLDAHLPAFTPRGVAEWIGTVRWGLEETYDHYPWVAYGTDWLAFGHIVIALFFIGPLVDPKSSRPVLLVGIAACVLVIPLALICGPIRGIPFYWRVIDCSFGVFGIVPLLYCLKLRREIASPE